MALSSDISIFQRDGEPPQLLSQGRVVQPCCFKPELLPWNPSGHTHVDSELIFGDTARQCHLLGTLPSKRNRELIHNCMWLVVYKVSQC